MSVTAAGPARSGSNRGFLGGITNRQLEHYPETGPRYFYLALTVVVTVALYYELYIGAAVATQQLPALKMSFSFYVVFLAISNLFGAFASLLAGLTDRLGRVNLVVGGLLVTGVLIAFVIPTFTTKWPFVICSVVVGIVEGICLVATPALIRDFSPQVGRAAAMGFWTMGPVLGSLVVSVVGTNTIQVNAQGVATTAWGHEYVLAGVTTLVVFVIAFIGLRELSPQLRDQLMVTLHDRALIEARAKGIDVEETLHHPWRQMFHVNVILSALGVSVLLVIYYTMVGFGTVYFETIFGFNAKNANGVLNWAWAADVFAVIAAGQLSDRLRVRKPFMLVGGVGTAVMIVVYLNQATNKHPGYYTIAVILMLLLGFLGLGYSPWMASFTETVEDHNPALTATGLAIWGWIIRVVVFVSYIILPHIVSSMNSLVQDGPYVQAFASATAAKQAPPPAVTAYLHAHPNAVKNVLAAAKHSPAEWQHWYWICFGCAVFFIPCIFLMHGFWSPSKAKAAEDAHDAEVDAEMERLHISEARP